ncbi:MAG: BBP7 family outer membrane beta-barrel protein [Thermoguttaceae bacterium]|jgi:hypothetical protein
MRTFFAVPAVLAVVASWAPVAADETLDNPAYQLVAAADLPVPQPQPQAKTSSERSEEAGGTSCMNGSCFKCPTLVARFSTLCMQRERPESVPIFSNPGGESLLDASQFHFDYRPGIDLSLISNRGCDRAVEVRYLWLDDSRSNAAFDFPAGNNATDTRPSSFFGSVAGGTANFHDQSELQTLEFNLRKHLEWLDLICGFRYVDFSDRIAGVYTFNDIPGAETQSWDARNNLYGIQVGAEAALWESRGGLRIDASVKAGLYDNQVRTHFLTNFVIGGSAFANAADDHFAFLGELGFTATYPLTCHMALRAGYQMLWLDGVALAGKQVPATGNINAVGEKVSRVDAASTVFYQGFTSGVEITW